MNGKEWKLMLKKVLQSKSKKEARVIKETPVLRKESADQMLDKYITMFNRMYLRPDNLFDILNRLDKNGIGSRVRRERWRDGCYYEITKVIPRNRDGRHGRVFGKFYWDFENKKNNDDVKIRTCHKKGVWKLVTEETFEDWVKNLKEEVTVYDDLKLIEEQDEKYANNTTEKEQSQMKQ